MSWLLRNIHPGKSRSSVDDVVNGPCHRATVGCQLDYVVRSGKYRRIVTVRCSWHAGSPVRLIRSFHEASQVPLDLVGFAHGRSHRARVGAVRCGTIRRCGARPFACLRGQQDNGSATGKRAFSRDRAEYPRNTAAQPRHPGPRWNPAIWCAIAARASPADAAMPEAVKPRRVQKRTARSSSSLIA